MLLPTHVPFRLLEYQFRPDFLPKIGAKTFQQASGGTAYRRTRQTKRPPRTISQMAMPAATLTLSECLVPNWGISSTTSAASTTS